MVQGRPSGGSNRGRQAKVFCCIGGILLHWGFHACLKGAAGGFQHDSSAGHVSYATLLLLAGIWYSLSDFVARSEPNACGGFFCVAVALGTVLY